MKKRKVIVTAAVAATVAASSVVMSLYPVHAQTMEPSTISKAADILGVDQNQLLDAFKKAKIETIEDNIQKGVVDAQQGIELIHKIEDSNDFAVLPKPTKP